MEFDMDFRKFKVWQIVLAVIIIFIPTYIAVASYIAAQNAPPSKGNVSSLVITDTMGNIYELLSGDGEDTEQIDSFVGMLERAPSLPALPEQLDTSNPYSFVYKVHGKDLAYKYYFSQNPSESYFTDHEGHSYHILDADAMGFLKTKYARALYPDRGIFPTMAISGEAVSPATASWEYTIYGGTKVKIDDFQLADNSHNVYKMKGAFALDFDVKPDLVLVNLYDSESNLLFSDTYDNIANANIEGKTVNVYVEAYWYETADLLRVGSATYEFRAKVLLPAAFYLNTTSITAGDFLVLTAKNIDDPSQISFSSNPDIGYAPKFYTDGDYVKSLIPVNMDFPEGTVTFTFGYGEVVQDMVVSVGPSTARSKTIEVSADVINRNRTPEALQAYSDLIATLSASTASTPLWDNGIFLEGVTPDNNNILLTNTFGLNITLSGDGSFYRNDGIDYFAPAGTDIVASNTGTVVYVGHLDYLGNTVVIDHGLGLKTWYAHLSDTSVEMGAAINKGDVVGHVGSTGFATRTMFHYGMFIDNVPVSPFTWFEYPLAFAE